MQPFSVIENIDVFKGGGLNLGLGCVEKAMHSLVLGAVEPALRWRIVPAISFVAHRADHAVFLEPVLNVWLAYWLPRSE